MRNKFLTIAVFKFLYQIARIKKNRKPKPLVRKMSDAEWELAQSQIEEIKMEQGLRN
jgi:hypothetical protein